MMPLCCFFLFKQKTAYELRISDWSSDVCSSDLVGGFHDRHIGRHRAGENAPGSTPVSRHDRRGGWTRSFPPNGSKPNWARPICASSMPLISFPTISATPAPSSRPRSEEHTAELQSLMRLPSAVFCLKNKK